MALIGWTSSWIDTVKPVKATIRAYMRDQLAHYFAAASDVNAIDTASTKAILINGFPFVLDAADVSSADDGVNVIVSNDGGRYKRATIAREVLTAARSYYVRADGSDSNNGLANTAGGAFLTIGKAIDTACALDMSIYDVTISVGAGTFDGFVCKPFVGSGTITIAGAPSTINGATPGIGVRAEDCGKYAISGLTISGGNYCALARGRSTLTVSSSVTFGSATLAQILIDYYARCTISADYTITGGSNHHVVATGGVFICSGRTITITGTPAFSLGFAAATLGGLLNVPSTTYSGSTTGPRYLSKENGVITTWGGGASYFPGDAAGSPATGGQYV